MAVRLTALALVLAGASLATTAHAQTEDDERARLHFESGRSYFAEGAYDRALQEFEQAYELSPRTPMLFNLGTTYERLGRLEEARDAFQRYLDESGPDAQNRELLERRVANLERRIDARARGEELAEDQPEGSATAPASAGPSSAPPPGDDGGDGLVLGGAIALGVAGAGFVLTGILGGLALAEESSVQDGCFAMGSCTPDDVSSMDTLAVAADVAWISASVVAAAGVVLVVLGALSDGGGDDARAALRFTGTGLAGSFR
ncbi:MAG TPA: tetratricopeptide repeat protein [Sandaracinaceae bacterium LLY-WYZ-13_1]|nr:tetratricopeptide repeat protein [Sandaracinaceae bacterium LLY-WYZ-13_1]